MDNHILVCTTNIKNTRKLVERGNKIAGAYGGKCIILTVAKEEYNEMDYNAYVHRKAMEEVSQEFQAELIYISSKGKKLYEIISKISLEREIGHIIIGQPVRTKWNILTEGSLINELFEELDDVDLHIVEVNKEGLPEKEYDEGVRVSIEDFDGDFDAIFPNESIKDKKGVFYRSTYSEFTNGIVRIKRIVDNKEIDCLYRVVENEIIFERENG